MKRLVHIAIYLSSLLAGRSAIAEVKRGDVALDFEAKSLSGETIKLSSLRGRVVLLDFWASWCEPCKKELPLLAKLAPGLKAKGIEIVAVNIDEQVTNAAEFVRSHKLKLTVVVDTTQEIVKKYEPAKMPSSFAIDRDGRVQAINEGFEEGDETKLAKQLGALAAK